MPLTDPQALIGRNLIGSDAEKIGSVYEVYLDNSTRRPAWVSVKTGWFGSNVSVVPITQATERNGDICVPFDKNLVSNAPNHDPGEELSSDDEEELYRYYGLSDRQSDAATDTVETDRSTVTRDASRTEDTRGRGAADDDAMTRSEERLAVGKESVETGRVRLRKYVVTENVQQTVPVSHEEVRLEREPVTDANRDAATSGPDITEAEHEVTLHGERPVVEKEVRPVERVRLGTETHTDEEPVSEEVRKEHIEVEDDRRSN